MTQLTDQTVLVTGANRGLGAAFVTALLERGVTKIYAAARDPRSVTVTDPRVVALQLDVTNPDSVRSAVEQAPDVTVLINNAGIADIASVLAKDPSTLRRELETNLFGPLALTAAYADSLAERGGAIVNIASALSWAALGGSYGVTKAALWSATDATRLDLAPRGVQVVGVYVGYMDTDMVAGVEAPKSAPADVVRQVLDGVESGALEVLADDTSRTVRSALHLPVEQRYPQLAPAGV